MGTLANGRGSGENEVALLLPHPSDASRSVAWNGKAFDLDGQAARVLAYDVTQSGWTDELTQLHEDVGGSSHFIDVASRLHAIDEVCEHVVRVPSVVLEVGVSSGFLLKELVSRLPRHIVIGADYTRGTLDALARRTADIPLVQFDLARCPLENDFVDIAVLLNVLEHIEDHERAVAELFRIMRPGGTAIIEVPAGSSLFDVFDRGLMHYRRYDMADLLALLRRAGFDIDRRSHLGFFIYPLFYLSKRLNQLRYPTGAAIDERKIASNMIAATRKSGALPRLVMRLERALRPHISFPFGVRCLVTCRKPA
jgi:SAM-dependent methyltransferase